MSFHDVSLPDSFQYGSVFGGGFNTVIQTTSTGHEYRLARQQQARHRYRLLKQLQTTDEALALKSFAIGRRGSLHSFRLKDWSDYTSAEDGRSTPTNLDQRIGVGDGTRKSFYLYKTYDESGDAPYQRLIELPIAGSVVCAIAGSGTSSFTFSNPGGLVTFSSAPGGGDTITAGFSFDVPVRFDGAIDSWNQMRSDAFSVWTLEQLECVEVLGEVQWPELWNPGGWKSHGATALDVSISYAEGSGHDFAPSTAINVFLPAPDRFVGGPRHFVIENLAGSSGTLQVRDDSGNTVGGTIAAGVIKQIGLSVSGGTFRWVIY